MLSTARLLGAQANTFRPRRIAWRMTSTTVVVLPVPGGPWISPTSRADMANCTASSCTVLSEPSRAATSRSTPNSGPPQAEEHVAEDRRAVAAQDAGLFQGGPLPLGGHFVESDVDPPHVVLAQFVGQAVDRDRDRDLRSLAYDAAIGKLRAILVRREDHGTADVEAGPAERPAVAAKELAQ